MAPDRPAGPLAEALDRIGDRWSLLVVEALLDGPRRFGELQGRVTRIAPNVLTQRLRHLEREGVIRSRRYSERPPRLEYELNASGRELAGAVRVLREWGARHAGHPEAGVPRHAACGTPLETRAWCATCSRTVDEAEPAELHHL